MVTYNKYIYRQISRYFLTIFAVSITIVWLTQALRFIELITAQGLSLVTFAKITLQLLIPMTYVVIPVSLFMAAISLLYHLYHEREIIILRNAGLNNWQIIKPVIIYSFLICLIHYAISFYLLPKSYRDFKDSKEYYKNQFATLLLEEGVFNTQSNKITVYIDEKVGANYFKGIFIHNMLDNLKPVTIIAESGYIIRTDAGPEFVLYNGTHQEKNVKTGNVSIVTFNSYKFSMAKYEPSQTSRQLESNELYIHQLFSSFDISDKDTRFNVVNGNQRIIWPLYTLLLPMLAGAAVLAGQFNRRFAWKRASLAGGIGTLFIILSLVLNSLATKHVWMIILMYGNTLAALAAGVKLLYWDDSKQRV